MSSKYIIFTVKNMSDKEVEQVIELNKAGYTNIEIAEILKTKSIKIGRILRRLKLKAVLRKRKTEKSIFTQEEELKICELYKEGKSIYEILKIFNSYYSLIHLTLKRNNVVMRDISSAGRKLKVNDNYFKTIDTFDKAYFLGLLMADGTVNKKSNLISLTLSEKDVEIIKKFKEVIEYDGIIGTSSKKLPKSDKYNKYVNISISSPELKKDLIKLGCISAKTHHTYFPDIPEEFHSHFIRGVFDGDGSISLTKKNSGIMNIVGNLSLIQKIQNILVEKCNITETKLAKHDKLSDNKIYYLIHGGAKLKQIYSYLYQDCQDLYLKRKKEIFEKVINLNIRKYKKKQLNQFINEIKNST